MQRQAVSIDFNRPCVFARRDVARCAGVQPMPMSRTTYQPMYRCINYPYGDYRIGTQRYNWPMSAHASQAFSTSTVPIQKIYQKVFRIGTVCYNWPMSAHTSQPFSIAHCTLYRFGRFADLPPYPSAANLLRI